MGTLDEGTLAKKARRQPFFALQTANRSRTSSYLIASSEHSIDGMKA